MPSSGANNGSGFGNGLLIQGNQSVTLDPGSGQTLSIAGVIADEHGSVASDPNASTLAIDGAGTVVLSGINTYTGGTVIAGGTLEITAAGAAGSGAISFGPALGSTLRLDADGGAFTNPLTGDLSRATIDLAGLTYAQGATTELRGDTLTVCSDGVSETLDVPGLLGASLRADGTGGIDLAVAACYAAGTLMATARGPVAVEALRVGEAVQTLSGWAPVVWRGWTRVIL